MNLVAVTLPDAASIVTFPAVSPLWTMKFLLAIVPCLPDVLLCIIRQLLIFMAMTDKIADCQQYFNCCYN
jgi:hypothetical protein